MGDEQVARIAAVDERVDQLGPDLVQQPVRFVDDIKLDEAAPLGEDRRCRPLYILHSRQSDGKGSSTFSSAQSHPVECRLAKGVVDGGFWVVNKRLVALETG